MKKLFKTLFIITITLLLFTACSSNNNSADNNTSGTTVVLIGISPDYPPYESLNTSNQIEGFDVDMTEWLFNYLKDNGHDITFEWKQMSFDTIISAIQTDQVDLGISGFTYDSERKVLFSTPYFKSAEVVLVNADSDINALEDLKGKHIGVQMGTTGESCANDIEDADVMAIEDMGICVQTLQAGGVDAVIADLAVANNYAASGNFKVLDEMLLDEDNYIIAKEGNDELMNLINEAIEAFKASDDYNKLAEKWGL